MERNSLVTLDVDVEAELAAKYSVSVRSLLLVSVSTSRAGRWDRDRSYRSVGRYKLLINILSLSLSILHYSILILCHIRSYTSPRLTDMLENRSDRYRQSWLSRTDNLSASSVSPTHWL